VRQAGWYRGDTGPVASSSVDTHDQTTRIPDPQEPTL
jgi:hypothetical protein